MIYIFFVFIFVIGIIYFLLNKSSNKIIQNGSIEGNIFSKLTNDGVEGAKVSLGIIDGSNNTHKFIIENSMTQLTDKDGKFQFNGIKIKEYWIIAEYKGKKVLKLLKFEGKTEIKDVLLIV